MSGISGSSGSGADPEDVRAGASAAPHPADAADAASIGDGRERGKSDYEPNPGKELDLISAADSHTWRRLPLQTELVVRGDDLEALAREHVERFAAALPDGTVPGVAPWYFVISEKIVVIAQGRFLSTWEIQPRISTKVLSCFVARTPAGIGLSHPATMELAIRDVGLPRIAVAALIGGAGRAIGKKGLFYELAGTNVRALDGPTGYSAFPANVSAMLPSRDPDTVAARLSAAIRRSDIPTALRRRFVGTVVMDADDLGRTVRGSDVATADKRLEEAFADNPLGQGGQRTPVAILADLGAGTRP